MSCKARAIEAGRAACGYEHHQPALGLGLLALKKAHDIDVLIGAQAVGVRRHFDVECLALCRELDGVAQFRVAQADGGRIVEPAMLCAAIVIAGRKQETRERGDQPNPCRGSRLHCGGALGACLHRLTPASGYSTIKR